MAGDRNTVRGSNMFAAGRWPPMPSLLEMGVAARKSRRGDDRLQGGAKRERELQDADTLLELLGGESWKPRFFMSRRPAVAALYTCLERSEGLLPDTASKDQALNYP